MVSLNKVTVYSDNLQRTIVVHNWLCRKCRVFHYKKEKLGVENEKDDLEQTFNDPSVNIRLKTGVGRLHDKRIEVPIQTNVSNHKYSCVRSISNETTIITEEACLQFFIKVRIHIPAGNRCCWIHLTKNRFYEEYLSYLKVYFNSSKLTASKLKKWWGISPFNVILPFMIKVETSAFPRNSSSFLPGPRFWSESRLRSWRRSLWESVVCP